MLKLRFAPFAVIGLSAAIAFAQEAAPDAPSSAGSKPDAPKVETVAPSDAATDAATTPAPIRRRKRKPVAVATPVPVATPAPKKLGFWERVFGKKKAGPTPAPATPKPTTPKPVVKTKTTTKPTTPKPTTTDTKPETNKIEKVKVEPVKPTEPKEPLVKSDDQSKPPTIKTNKRKGDGEKVQNFPPPPDSKDPDVLEKQKYDQAKAKAVADPKIQELRAKADLAPTEDESRKALRAYNKAMFKRMKEIDPSIKDHVDRMEAAVMSRLGE